MPPAPFIILENKYERRNFRFLQIAFTKKLGKSMVCIFRP